MRLFAHGCLLQLRHCQNLLVVILALAMQIRLQRTCGKAGTAAGCVGWQRCQGQRLQRQLLLFALLLNSRAQSIGAQKPYPRTTAFLLVPVSFKHCLQLLPPALGGRQSDNSLRQLFFRHRTDHYKLLFGTRHSNIKQTSAFFFFQLTVARLRQLVHAAVLQLHFLIGHLDAQKSLLAFLTRQIFDRCCIALH